MIGVTELQLSATGKPGDGKVFNMNWRLPNYHKNNESIDQIEKLTENVINWLASESEFADVSAGDKLPIVWGHLKIRSSAKCPPANLTTLHY